MTPVLMGKKVAVSRVVKGNDRRSVCVNSSVYYIGIGSKNPLNLLSRNLNYKSDRRVKLPQITPIPKVRLRV
jgi:hypothetical protein